MAAREESRERRKGTLDERARVHTSAAAPARRDKGSKLKAQSSSALRSDTLRRRAARANPRADFDRPGGPQTLNPKHYLLAIAELDVALDDAVVVDHCPRPPLILITPPAQPARPRAPDAPAHPRVARPSTTASGQSSSSRPGMLLYSSFLLMLLFFFYRATDAIDSELITCATYTLLAHALASFSRTSTLDSTKENTRTCCLAYCYNLQ